MKTTILAGAALLSLTLGAGAAEPVGSAREAVARLMETQDIGPGVVRVFELAERMTPGITRWRVNFVDAEALWAIKIDGAGETEVLTRMEGPTGFYAPDFARTLPEPGAFPDPAPFVEKARALVAAAEPGATVEPGHILVYKICQPAVDGKPPATDAGCARDVPMREWRVFLKVTSPGGDWTVRKVLFADDAPGAISEGPKGYFR